MAYKELSKKIQGHSFWALTGSEVADILQTEIQNGISGEEAKKRLKIFGENIIEKEQFVGGFYIFLNQFKSPLILILVLAGIITLFISHYRDAFFIFAAVIVNAALGFYQEYKAEKTLAEIKTYLKQRARVIRGGIEREIDAAYLVPGDIIRIAQGDRVPADGRLVYVNDLQVDESVLTGESLPTLKTIESVNMDATLGDQQSMVFAGTLVSQGVGTVIVCSTDLSAEIGKIASLVAESHREETPLQKAIERFSVRAGIVLMALTVAIFFIGVMLGYSKVEMFLTSVAIAVSAVPEGLPVAMTVILAIGVQRMAKRKGVIRKLVAAESLGSATVILTDKTGTLTMAKMELNKILPTKNGKENELLELALINTNVLVENPNDNPAEWRMNGRALEKALVQSAAFRGVLVGEIKDKISTINFLPFNAVNKFSASLIEDKGIHKLVFFGAPDIFIRQSNFSLEKKNDMLKQMDLLAESGEFIVGVATREVKAKKDFNFSKDLEFSELNFEGLITLRDPIRPNVKDVIYRIGLAGIKTLIMTGDHRGTAEAIAKKVGIHNGKGSVLDAAELQLMSDIELKKLLPTLSVISRVSPFDKMRIVKAFQELGEVVAMTGDGVNDAPSIKQANIGIAMGSGTEVARDVADLVLLDDNFETIVAAVEEGRQIMNNIRKVLVYLLSSVTDELILIGGSLLVGIALPLNALQLLWVNFFSDSFPAIAFAFEKNTDGPSFRPRSAKKGLFDPLVNLLIIYIGFSTSALLFILYWVLLKLGFSGDIVRTFIFGSFGTYTLFLSFSIKSLERSIFEYSLFSNLYLVSGVGIGIALMGVAIYIPFFQELFGTVSLPFNWVLGVIGIGGFNIVLVETGKWFFRREHKFAKA